MDDRYIRIDGKLKQELKILAAKKGISMKDLLKKMVIEGLKKEEGK
jgi:plasmid stability protein